MHVLNAITPPAPTSINRVMERPSERTCSLTFHVLFHSIARVRSFRVRASLSLSLPLPLKGRGCDTRDVASPARGSLSFGLTSRSLPLPRSVSLPLSRGLAHSLARFHFPFSHRRLSRTAQRSGDFFGSATFLVISTNIKHQRIRVYCALSQAEL